VNPSEADRILQTLWDADARPWHENWVPIFRKFAKDLVSQTKLSTGEIVMDVGTGTGVAALEAASIVSPGGLVFGIDRSRPMLALAERERRKAKVKNTVFLEMSGERVLFPGGMFDAVISNCGISYATYPGTITEAYRILQPGGKLAYNDWHLLDVPAHRTFGMILQQYRTENPSPRLQRFRTAIATMERLGNRYLSLETQTNELRKAGFGTVRTWTRNYEIRMPGIRDYLKLRLQREALRLELSELSSSNRSRLLVELKRGLRRFVRRGRFRFKWKVTFIQARKSG